MRPRTQDELTSEERRARLAASGYKGPLPQFVRDRMRELLERFGYAALQDALSDPQATHETRLRAVEILSRFGVGTTSNLSVSEGDDALAGVIVLPELQYNPGIPETVRDMTTPVTGAAGPVIGSPPAARPRLLTDRTADRATG